MTHPCHVYQISHKNQAVQLIADKGTARGLVLRMRGTGTGIGLESGPVMLLMSICSSVGSSPVGCSMRAAAPGVSQKSWSCSSAGGASGSAELLTGSLEDFDEQGLEFWSKASFCVTIIKIDDGPTIWGKRCGAVRTCFFSSYIRV